MRNPIVRGGHTVFAAAMIAAAYPLLESVLPARSSIRDRAFSEGDKRPCIQPEPSAILVELL